MASSNLPIYTVDCLDEYGSSYTVGTLFSIDEVEELLSSLLDAEENNSSFYRRCLISDLESFLSEQQSDD